MSKANKRERQRQNREARRQLEEQIARRRRTMRTIRNFAIIAVPVLAIGVILAATSGGDDEKAEPAPVQYATLTTSKGEIVAEISSDEAPKSAAQFVRLANQGFYNGLKFHRVASAVGIIQSGAPNGDGTGGSGTTVEDELPETPYKIGDLAFAKGGPNTSDSQFFIVTGEPGTQLPRDFNRFGKVISGLDVAQAIEALSPASGDGPPTEEVLLEGVKIAKKNPTTTTTAAPTTAASTTAAATAPPSS